MSVGAVQNAIRLGHDNWTRRSWALVRGSCDRADASRLWQQVIRARWRIYQWLIPPGEPAPGIPESARFSPKSL
jgi:hypothetical protein